MEPQPHSLFYGVPFTDGDLKKDFFDSVSKTPQLEIELAWIGPSSKGSLFDDASQHTGKDVFTKVTHVQIIHVTKNSTTIHIVKKDGNLSEDDCKVLFYANHWSNVQQHSSPLIFRWLKYKIFNWAGRFTYDSPFSLYQNNGVTGCVFPVVLHDIPSI